MRRLLMVLACVHVSMLPSIARPRRTTAAAALSILVFDYAAASPALPAAFREAERILAPSGVKFTFIACPDSPAAMAAIPGCTREPRAGSVIVDLLARSASRRAAVPNAFGYADTAPETGLPSFAGVFYDRVEDLGRARMTSQPALILGAVIAHEVGHLLLGSAAHSASGIMTAHWTPEVLLALEQGRLLFSNRQASRLRANVVSRQSGREIYTLAAARQRSR